MKPADQVIGLATKGGIARRVPREHLRESFAEHEWLQLQDAV